LRRKMPPAKSFDLAFGYPLGLFKRP